ncbi:TolC family protein [Undibacterium sp. Ren11W]|uniref:TolC family protein n=1 Tax=Undibacterium sp. Ren11W TaxID=3413045 RepID=UPI003BF32477
MKNTHLLKKIRRNAVSLICINLFCWPQVSIASETLEQAWVIALQRDHTLAAAQQKERGAAHQVAAAQANYLPKLALDAGYLRTESEPAAKVNIPALPFLKGAVLPFAQDGAYFGGVSVSAPLYTGGKISSGVGAAQAQAEAVQARSQLSKSELKLALAHAYIMVLRAEHAVTVANSHVAAVARHVSDVQALFNQGYVARHDLLASQVALANAQQLALQTDNGLAMARAAYNRWLGRPQDGMVDILDIGVSSQQAASGDLASLLSAADSQRKELQELDQQSLAYKKQAASVAAGHLPQIGISAGWSKLENRYLAEDKGWWVGVVMKWELFDGGLIRHQAAQLSATSQAIQEMQEDTRERIALQVRQSWLAQQEAQARMALVGKASEQADETLLLARERYRSGLAPNSEVLDAETRRLQAYSNRDNAIYDRELARLQLQYASGQL